MKITRAQVVAHRVAAQGLHRDTADTAGVAGLAVLDLGVQEAMGHPASLAFAARLPASADVRPPVGPGEDLALAWTFRGAPHVHRRSELDSLAAALWPLSEADATGRLNETGPSVARAGIPALEQYAAAVRELRASVTAPTAKGAVSTAVTRRLPDAMARDCRPCKARHISDSAMRTSFLAAGLELEPATSPPVLLRRRGAKPAKKPDLAALGGLARRYLALLGPCTVGDFAGYLEARRADVAAAWPDDLETVTVDGRQVQADTDTLAALRSAPDAELVRLLGPFDPYLQARDRDLIVPDKAVQKVLWPVLGRPGALFVDGEIVGTWRARATKSALMLTIEAFAPLPKATWSSIEDEAQSVGRARALDTVSVTRTS